MKTKLLLTVLSFFVITISAKNSFAQTVQILQAIDSTIGYCGPPAEVQFWNYVQATGYLPGDSLTYQVNFGDGTDTTLKIAIPNGYVNFYVHHTYLTSGFFSVQYIATGPNGIADTTVTYDEVFVGSSCGNIEGRVYVDHNSDCIYNAGDEPVYFQPIHAFSTGGNVHTAYDVTDANGNYYISAADNLTYDVLLGGVKSKYTYGCPGSGMYNAQSVPASGLDFSVHCIPGYDLDGSIDGWGFIPGVTAWIGVNGVNNRCGDKAGVMKVVLDPLLTYSSADIPPTSISGDTLIWDPYTFEELDWNFMDIFVLTSPNAQIGDSVLMTLIMEPIAGDSVPGNNITSELVEVKSSWDPNVKEVNPKSSIVNGEELDYTVMFQNTGTAPAMNIYILDTLDDKLDISTFHFTGSSHPCQVTFNQNVVKFYFHNINLPDSNTNESESHGLVTYSIYPKPDLEIGTHIFNTAAIYFDFNPAVITNTTDNMISGATAIENQNMVNQSLLFPNPASLETTLKMSGDCDAIIIVMSIDGRIIKETKSTGCISKIDLRHVPDGMYVVRVKNEEQEIVSKLIVAH